MATLHELPNRQAFGPFEVDTAAGELLKGGIRVRLPRQPFAILIILLKNAGEVVTRDQFRDQIWSEGTFVNFEQGLNTAMNKLRTALGDPAEKPRYIETVPGRGYRFIGLLEPHTAPPVDLAHVSERRGEIPPKRSVRLWWWLASAAACLVAFATGLRLRYETAPSPIPKLTRITNEAGLSEDPALSADGKLVAYSSDLGREGGKDLYVKQTAGGQTIRLTFDGEGNTMPDFSPDGSRIVFRSNRNGGGIYEVPTFGGEARLLARDGLDPRFSPDGSRVAYWVGAKLAQTIPGAGAVWVVPASGGQPERVSSNFTSAMYPIWSPDSTQILFVGYTSAEAFQSDSLDWWIVSVNGGRAVRTGAHHAFLRAGLQYNNASTPIPAVPIPGCWADDSALIFSFDIGGVQNLWKISLSPQSGEVSGAPRRMTTGSGNEAQPSCASNGNVAFANLTFRNQVWSLPFDLNRAISRGALARVEEVAASRGYPSLSREGNHLAFVSDLSGHQTIWIRDLETGQQLTVAASPFAQRYPVTSPSGSKVAFSSYEKDKRIVYEAAPGGEPVKLCVGCLRATGWSHDEKSLLVFGGDPYRIDLLDIASRKRTALITHPSWSLLYGRFSPDERWVSFTARVEPGRGRIAIARLDGQRPVPESAWITISDVGAEDYANWSPDGKTIYFTSGRDGNNCLWGQRIDANSGRPVGEVFAVQHFHGRTYFDHVGWSAAGGRIALALRESTGSIWTMSPSGRRASGASRK
jgi:Tol biopolymer transport system component/DNA-binding winged helix-turn-helix (wHTH) protein